MAANKKIFLLTVLLLFIVIQPTYASYNPIANPASVYCNNLGYQTSIQTNLYGDQGFCQLPDGNVVDEWKFLLGDIGQDYNYCGLKGYTTEISSDPSLTDYYLTNHVALCVLPDSSRVEVGELMKMRYDLKGMTEYYEKCPVFQPLNNIVITEETPIQIELKATDPNNDPIIFSCAMLPTGSALSGNVFDWIPQQGQSGNYMLAFVATDGTFEAFQTTGITVLSASTENGQLTVSSDPPAARIFLDGTGTGKVTPYTFVSLKSGSHTVNVSLSGYITPGDEIVAVPTNDIARIHFDLQKQIFTPEFPSLISAGVLILGFLGVILFIQKKREN